MHNTSTTTTIPPDPHLSPYHIKPRSRHFDFEVLRKIGCAKFRVYLILSKADNAHYALKAYPHTEKGINERFIKESQLSHFFHPNVCKIVHNIPEKLTSHNSGLKMYSFLVLEYAPYGDFYELFKKRHASLSERLARTYFHQLIEGLEYLHKNNIAHLDIKSENLLIGQDFQLKITDFDLSQSLDDPKLESKGTLCYRAPEVISGQCKDFTKADIYSAGIMLFVLRSGGIPPHLEQEDYQGINLYRLLEEDQRRFWTKHEAFQGKGKFYSDSFRELFQMMTEMDPMQRATIAAVKQSRWYNEPILTKDQLKTEMKSLFM